LDEFILYSSLDIIDRVKGVSSDAYLKVVDRFNDYSVSAFVPISSVRFLLLHKQPANEEAMRQFFQEAYVHYARLVSDFAYTLGSVITQPAFDQNIQGCSRKFLG